MLARPDHTYGVGEPVTGTVTVEVDAPCESVRLRLASEWRTGGRGDAETGGRVESVLFEGAWQPGGASYPFTFDAPWGPLSYRGRELTVAWYVEAHADLPWALDPRAELEWTLVAPPPPDRARAVSLGPRHGDEGWEGELLGLAEELTGRDLGPALAAIARRVGLAARPALGLLLLAAALWALDFGRAVGVVGLALAAGGVWLLARGALPVVARWRVGPVEARLTADEVHRGAQLACIIRLARPWLDRRERVTATLTARERIRETVGGVKNRRTVTHITQVHAETVPLASTRRIGADDVELQGVLKVPVGAPPTFAGRSNALEWEVTIRVAPRWSPAWERRIPITVRP